MRKVELSAVTVSMRVCACVADACVCAYVCFLFFNFTLFVILLNLDLPIQRLPVVFITTCIMCMMSLCIPVAE